MKITIEELYKSVVNIIISEDKRFSDSVYGLAKRALLESFTELEVDELMRTNEMHDMLFSLEELMRKKAKENGYTMRLVPVKEEGGRWGLPYNFDYYFAKRED